MPHDTTPARRSVRNRFSGAAPTVWSLLIAFALSALAAAVAKTLELVVSLPDPAMVFLTAVLFAAVVGGLAASMVTAATSVLLYDFLFVDPRYTLTVTQPQDLVLIVVFVIVALLISLITIRARADANAANAKTEQVIEAIEDGLIVLDPNGAVTHVNEVACAILGVERNEVFGARFDDLESTHSHYFRLREAVREIVADPERERERVELTAFLRGRDHYYVLRPTAFRAAAGARAGLILVLQDVTYLRDQEHQRERLLATLSHELKTPLTSLQMALELVRRDAAVLDREARDLLETAQEDVGRLADVAQRFVDLARGRATSIALDRQPVDLAGLTARALRIFALQAREKSVRLVLRNPGNGTIVCDQTKLTWALSNLIANAVRYTPAGGNVAVDVSADGDAVRIAVADTGPGIPVEQRHRIFERFAQASDGGEIGTAGLGLAIVRDIVQAHGGRIHLESEVGRGTRFTIELPTG